MTYDPKARDQAIQEKRANTTRKSPENIPVPSESEIKEILASNNIWIPDDIIHNWWLQKKGDTGFWHDRPIQDWFYNLQWFSHSLEMKAKYGNEGLGSKEVFKKPAPPPKPRTPEQQARHEQWLKDEAEHDKRVRAAIDKSYRDAEIRQRESSPERLEARRQELVRQAEEYEAAEKAKENTI